MSESLGFTRTSSDWDNLIASHEGLQIETGILAGGRAYKRGEVLGKITANNKYTLADETETDGSQEADVICARDIDATSGDREGSIIVAGQIQEDELIFGGTLDADATRAVFRTKGIYLKSRNKVV